MMSSILQRNRKFKNSLKCAAAVLCCKISHLHQNQLLKCNILCKSLNKSGIARIAMEFCTSYGLPIAPIQLLSHRCFSTHFYGCKRVVMQIVLTSKVCGEGAAVSVVMEYDVDQRCGLGGGPTLSIISLELSRTPELKLQSTIKKNCLQFC